MAWLETISPLQAKEPLRSLYQQIADRSGQVDQVLQIHSLRPHTLIAHMGLYKATLHHAHNELPVWFLECIGIYVSRLNRCDYCDRHHTAGLQRLIAETERFNALNRALSKPEPQEPFSAAEQQVFRYVRTLTITPVALREADVTGLRQSGYTDGQILEINQAAAYFAYVNRSVLGLGVDSADEQLGMSPEDDADMQSWGHG